MQIMAFFEDFSLLWVLVVLSGLVAVWTLFLLLSSCSQQGMNSRSYRGNGYTYLATSTYDKWTPSLPSYVPPPPAQRIVPSQSFPVYRSLADPAPSLLPLIPKVLPTPPKVLPTPPKVLPTPPKVLPIPPKVLPTPPRALPTPPSTSFRVAVDPILPRYTTPTSSSPVVVDTRRPLYANPTSGSLTSVAGRQQGCVAQNRTQPVHKIPAPGPRPVVEGFLLHASVTEQVDDQYEYDHQIKTDSALHSTTRSVAGVYKCYNCKRKKARPEEPRKWTSKGICVEIWMSSTNRRYRTRLHSQLCNRCHKLVEPDVFKDDYVTKVVKVLDGWTGQNSVVKPLQHYPRAGSHQADKCNACRNGISH